MKNCAQCHTAYEDTKKFCRYDKPLTKFRLYAYRLTKTVNFLLVLSLIPGLALAGSPPITASDLLSDPPPPKARQPVTKEAFLAKLKQGIENLPEIDPDYPPITMIYEKENYGILRRHSPGLPGDDEWAVDWEAQEAFKQGYVVSAKCLKTLLMEKNFPAGVVRMLWDMYVTYNNERDERSSEIKKEEQSAFKKELESIKKSCDLESFAQVTKFVDDVSTVMNGAIETVNARIAKKGLEEQQAKDKAVAAQTTRAQRIRSGEVSVESISDARVFYRAKEDMSLIFNPMVEPSGEFYYLQGVIDNIDGNLFVCSFGDNYFAVEQTSLTKKTATSALRVGGRIQVVGQYTSNQKYRTVLGQPRLMAVLKAAWIE